MKTWPIDPTNLPHPSHIVACVKACEGINPEAVPDMLEAAKAMCNAFATSDDGSDLEPWFYEPFQMLQAAIQKAETQ